MDKDKIVLAGCTSMMLSVFIQLPLFCTLMFGIVQTIDPPTWVWVIFWIYVPASLLLAVVRGTIETLSK